MFLSGVRTIEHKIIIIMTNEQIEAIKKKIKSAFKGLEFIEDTHTYTVEGSKMVSVTTYNKRYEEEFDEAFMSKMCADKYNKENPGKPKRTALYYKLEWSKKRNEACTSGTKTHKFAEDYTNESVAENAKEQAVVEWNRMLNSKYITLFDECRLYCKHLKRAGTADKILLNTETGNLVIQDWKTNSTNILQVYNNKKLKEPFDKLPCNALNKYAIQLSTYQKMIENNTDLKVEALWITWLKQGDYTTLDEGKDEKKYKIIKTQADIDHALFKQFNVNSLADKID